jgi:hypothetical protein
MFAYALETIICGNMTIQSFYHLCKMNVHINLPFEQNPEPKCRALQNCTIKKIAVLFLGYCAE